MFAGMGVWEYFSPGGKSSRRHSPFETDARRSAVRVAARGGIHSSCMVGSWGTKPVVALVISVIYAIGVFRTCDAKLIQMAGVRSPGT